MMREGRAFRLGTNQTPSADLRIRSLSPGGRGEQKDFLPSKLHRVMNFLAGLGRIASDIGLRRLKGVLDLVGAPLVPIFTPLRPEAEQADIGIVRTLGKPDPVRLLP